MHLQAGLPGLNGRVDAVLLNLALDPKSKMAVMNGDALYTLTGYFAPSSDLYVSIWSTSSPKGDLCYRIGYWASGSEPT